MTLQSKIFSAVRHGWQMLFPITFALANSATKDADALTAAAYRASDQAKDADGHHEAIIANYKAQLGQQEAGNSRQARAHKQRVDDHLEKLRPFAKAGWPFRNSASQPVANDGKPMDDEAAAQNPSSLAPIEASNVFDRLTQKRMSDSGVDFLTAHARTRDAYPQLFARSCELYKSGSSNRTQQIPTPDPAEIALLNYDELFQRELPLANGDPIEAARRVRLKNPGLLPPKRVEAAPLPNSAPPADVAFHGPMLGFPPNTPRDVFSVAWYANGSKAMPVNKPAIHAALVGHFIGKGQTEAQARQTIAEQYPRIHEAKE